MLKLALTTFALVQVAYNGGLAAPASKASPASRSAVASGLTGAQVMSVRVASCGRAAATMASGVRSSLPVAPKGRASSAARAKSGDCTAATDSFYLSQVQKVAHGTFEIYAVREVNPSAKTDNSSGFYFGKVLLIGRLIQVLVDIKAGHNVTGADCLSAERMLQQSITDLRANASNVVPLLLTGEHKYEDILRRNGRALNAVFASAQACSKSSNPGKWLQAILTFQKCANEANAVIQNNDSSRNCLAASSCIAQSLASFDCSLGVRLRHHQV